MVNQNKLKNKWLNNKYLLAVLHQRTNRIRYGGIQKVTPRAQSKCNSNAVNYMEKSYDKVK